MALGIPIAFVYSVIPLAGSLIVIYSLAAFAAGAEAETAGEVN